MPGLQIARQNKNTPQILDAADTLEQILYLCWLQMQVFINNGNFVLSKPVHRQPRRVFSNEQSAAINHDAGAVVGLV